MGWLLNLTQRVLLCTVIEITKACNLWLCKQLKMTESESVSANSFVRIW